MAVTGPNVEELRRRGGRKGHRRHPVAVDPLQQQFYTQQRLQAQRAEQRGDPAALRLSAFIRGKAGLPLTGMEGDVLSKPGANEDQQRALLFNILSMAGAGKAVLSGIRGLAGGGLRDALEDAMIHWKNRDLPLDMRQEMAQEAQMARQARPAPRFAQPSMQMPYNPEQGAIPRYVTEQEGLPLNHPTRSITSDYAVNAARAMRSPEGRGNPWPAPIEEDEFGEVPYSSWPWYNAVAPLALPHRQDKQP